ncbi:hypothetical protein CBR_g38031 [Chara braunii]|uniref:Haem-binding uptake Tiki superfamily ChaN domain-containing protein n=1 Tax=Chara braunii TaxID=69332 RepID=A0A388K044_CHABU|nr:hypothetical protein CBR_g38031 [Chara braunii]|eukprot:GBG63408.1 hypothetical protein CBR_g38031 [Chara braunii]
MVAVVAGSLSACMRSEVSLAEQWGTATTSPGRDRVSEQKRAGVSHVCSCSHSSVNGSAVAIRWEAGHLIHGKRGQKLRSVKSVRTKTKAMAAIGTRVMSAATRGAPSEGTVLLSCCAKKKLKGREGARERELSSLSFFFGEGRSELVTGAAGSVAGSKRQGRRGGRARRARAMALRELVGTARACAEEHNMRRGRGSASASSRSTPAVAVAAAAAAAAESIERKPREGDDEGGVNGDLASQRRGECSTAGDRMEWRPRRRALMGAVMAGLIGATWADAQLAQAATPASVPGPKAPLWLLGDSGANSASGVSLESLNQSRVYDASALGEPGAIGDKARVWKTLTSARVIYLGESERSPDPDDRLLELNITAQLRELCSTEGEEERPITLVLQRFHRPMQEHLNLYISGKLSDDELRAAVMHWPAGRWEECLPLLHYARENGIRLVAGGVPDMVLRNVEAHGVKALSDRDRRKYVPPLGGGGVVVPGWERSSSLQEKLLPYKASLPRGPGPSKFAQARLLVDHTMAMTIVEVLADAKQQGIVVAITGASHVQFGAKGRAIPMRVAQKMKGISQVVVMLNPERQRSRVEGELPEADFLWYSAAKQCNRNCFDRAEVARVMGAAGFTRDSLPQDLQAGLDQGLVAPDVLKTFSELDQHPWISMFARRFQGLRERWLADPRFLQRLAIEEAISISTTLAAQYEKRRERFWSELEYVFTDVTRGALVDFFTVWLPAPTLSFRSVIAPPADAGGNGLLGLSALLGSLPDNAFQRGRPGENITVLQRVLAVVVGGGKLFGVGLVASMGTLSLTNAYMNFRQKMKPQKTASRRSPLLKTGLVYALFLATSSNLRYQQWVDLARFFNLQAKNDTPPPESAAFHPSAAIKDLPALHDPEHQHGAEEPSSSALMPTVIRVDVVPPHTIISDNSASNNVSATAAPSLPLPLPSGLTAAAASSTTSSPESPDHHR